MKVYGEVGVIVKVVEAISRKFSFTPRIHLIFCLHGYKHPNIIDKVYVILNDLSILNISRLDNVL